MFIFIYLPLAVLGLHHSMRFSLVAVVGGLLSSFGARLLLAEASLAGEHRLQGARASPAEAHGLRSCGSLDLRAQA